MLAANFTWLAARSNGLPPNTFSCVHLCEVVEKFSPIWDQILIIKRQNWCQRFGYKLTRCAPSTRDLYSPLSALRVNRGFFHTFRFLLLRSNNSDEASWELRCKHTHNWLGSLACTLACKPIRCAYKHEHWLPANFLASSSSSGNRPLIALFYKRKFAYGGGVLIFSYLILLYQLGNFGGLRVAKLNRGSLILVSLLAAAFMACQ